MGGVGGSFLAAGFWNLSFHGFVVWGWSLNVRLDADWFVSGVDWFCQVRLSAENFGFFLNLFWTVHWLSQIPETWGPFRIWVDGVLSLFVAGGFRFPFERLDGWVQIEPGLVDEEFILDSEFLWQGSVFDGEGYFILLVALDDSIGIYNDWADFCFSVVDEDELDCEIYFSVGHVVGNIEVELEVVDGELVGFEFCGDCVLTFLELLQA
jgi:hypothetical protein